MGGRDVEIGTATYQAPPPKSLCCLTWPRKKVRPTWFNRNFWALFYLNWIHIINLNKVKVLYKEADHKWGRSTHFTFPMSALSPPLRGSGAEENSRVSDGTSWISNSLAQLHFIDVMRCFFSLRAHHLPLFHPTNHRDTRVGEASCLWNAPHDETAHESVLSGCKTFS